MGHKDYAPHLRRYLLRKRPFCFWCNCPLTDQTATLDHLIPASRGGRTSVKNCQVACARCNHGKKDRDYRTCLIPFQRQMRGALRALVQAGLEPTPENLIRYVRDAEVGIGWATEFLRRANQQQCAGG